MMLKAFLGSLALLALTTQGPSAQTSYLIDYIQEAIRDIDGRFDNHFSLPRSRPRTYALAFEFADGLKLACPNFFPDRFEEARAHAFSAYIYYQIGNVQLERAKLGETWLDGAVQLLKNPAVAGLPTVIERQKLIPLGISRIAATMVRNAGGCSNQKIEMFAANVVAFASFGKLRQSAFKKSFVRREETDNGLGFVCYYDENMKDTSETSQGYLKLSYFNSYRYGTPISMIVDRGREIIYGKQSGTKPKALMLRTDCPLTPDPEFPIIQQWVNPAEGAVQQGATRGERMAAYYIDILVPDEIKRARNRQPDLPEPPQSYLRELREEVTKFEDLPLERNALQARFQMYRSRYGGRLMELYDQAPTYGMGKYPAWRVTIIDALNLK